MRGESNDGRVSHQERVKSIVRAGSQQYDDVAEERRSSVIVVLRLGLSILA